MTPVLAISLICATVFVMLFFVLGIVEKSKGVLSKTSQGISTVTDSALSEHEKEKAIQRITFDLAKQTSCTLGLFFIILLLTAVPIYAAEFMNIVSASDVFAFMISWQFVLGGSIYGGLLALLLGKAFDGPNKTDGSREGGYSETEKILHMIAFTPTMLKAMNAADEFVFRKSRRSGDPTGKRFVFITSIARGGTTACLNAFASLPAFGANTYRDMPFITSPVIWNAISTVLRRNVATRERAHRDGMTVGLNSPEAFDEVLWMMAWPEHYDQETIRIWDTDVGPGKQRELLQSYFNRIRAVRNCDYYISKNNANIARIGILKEMFPDCMVIVPLRRPGPHAASLLRQHLNFVRLQGEDSFTKRYMEDIGHFEFGEAHRPIGFPGFDRSKFELTDPNYWLTYWICAFKHISRFRESIYIVTQDDLRKDPNRVLLPLVHKLDSKFKGNPDFRGFFRDSSDEADESVFSHDLLSEANTLFEALSGRGQRVGSVAL